MEVTVVRSRRKTIAICVQEDLTVTLKVPQRFPQKEIDRILLEKEPWIQKQREKILKRNAEFEARGITKLTDRELKALQAKARIHIPARVAFWAPLVGVSYNRISIRNQRTRWGSCSSEGNLNFNCLLMLAPQEVIDYVVVHELCHRKEMNHSAAFWGEVARVLPEYKKYVKWLRDEGSLLMKRKS